ncbi:MAG: type III-A CRISPR-associated RAMP protein Csm3 [Calditrichia bacterium]
MKQLKTKVITGQIEVVTGLHIGAGNDTVEIGGMDNPIIKNPKDNMPYIPGSSLKGKMRALAEWYNGKVRENKGEPCQCGECDVCMVFGVSAASSGDGQNKAFGRGPTRIMVRDAFLSQDSYADYIDNDIPLVEEKSENSINRITAKATPRPIERVVPGTKFEFELAYRVLDLDDQGKKDEENFNKIVLKSLAMLEKDYLGGGGSRGNGKVKFINLKDEEGNSIQLPEV